jgi:hypothetical protein
MRWKAKESYYTQLVQGIITGHIFSGVNKLVITIFGGKVCFLKHIDLVDLQGQKYIGNQNNAKHWSSNHTKT